METMFDSKRDVEKENQFKTSVVFDAVHQEIIFHSIT